MYTVDWQHATKSQGKKTGKTMTKTLGTSDLESAVQPLVLRAAESIAARFPNDVWIEITPALGATYLAIAARTPAGPIFIDAHFALCEPRGSGYGFAATLGYRLPSQSHGKSGDLWPILSDGTSDRRVAKGLVHAFDEVVGLLMQGRFRDADGQLAA
jgi:hypothetical protein